MPNNEMSLGDRMKLYEGIEAERRFMPCVPVIARIDGRAFHTLCRNMNRPYDERMIRSMQETTSFLVKESAAKIGYTQSDEISLIFYSDHPSSQIFFDGKIHKMTSVLASLASAYFADMYAKWFGLHLDVVAFDCRCWTVPTKEEAVNCLIWREQDAVKNSITAAALSVYSHKELNGKNGADKQEMLHAKGINWNDYPAMFKRRSYFRRHSFEREMTAEELARIPEKHRPLPGSLVTRSEMLWIDMPPLAQVVNRMAVVFDGEEPELAKENSCVAGNPTA